MSDTYHDGHRLLQDRFDTRRLADRIDEGLVDADFERRRLNGVASVDELMEHYPEAQFMVRVRAREVFPNRPRPCRPLPVGYRCGAAHTEHEARSLDQPVLVDVARAVLPADDPARSDT